MFVSGGQVLHGHEKIRNQGLARGTWWVGWGVVGMDGDEQRPSNWHAPNILQGLPKIVCISSACAGLAQKLLRLLDHETFNLDLLGDFQPLFTLSWLAINFAKFNAWSICVCGYAMCLIKRELTVKCKVHESTSHTNSFPATPSCLSLCRRLQIPSTSATRSWCHTSSPLWQLYTSLCSLQSTKPSLTLRGSGT